MDQLIREAKNIVISTHVRPDADGIGSGLALMEIINLNFTDKNLFFVVDDHIPESLTFLPNSEKIVNIENLKDQKIDLAIAVDAPNLTRLGKVESYFENIKILNIDHHISNSSFGHKNIIDPKSSSTAEMVVDIIKEYDFKINEKIATNLYAGILYDTGNFMWATSPKTLEYGAYLVREGADSGEISKRIFQSKSIKNLQLIGRAIENMKYDKSNNFLSSFILQKDLKDFQATEEDCGGIIEVLKSSFEVETALLLKEQVGEVIRGSIRTIKRDANGLAKTFNGGGHFNAAGFTSDLKVDDILQKIKDQL